MRITRPRGLRAAATGAGALVLAAGLTTAALAAVSGTPTTAANGNAGYNATTASAQGFTDVQSVVDPNQYALTIKSGAQGVQLCNSTTGFGAQVGLLSNNLTTVFAVAHSLGTIPAPGCPTGGVIPGGAVFPALSAVPYGHHVWVHAYLTTKVKRIKVLICYPVGIKPPHNPEPTATPTVSPSGTPSPTGSPTVSPAVSPSPTTTATTAALVWKNGGEPGGQPKYRFICVWKSFAIIKHVVVFEAQDLDALTVGAPAGDQPGVQTAYAHVPANTVFNNAGAGVNENLTGVVACTGLAADGFTYPRTLVGPAAYVSDACQPVSVFSYATASDSGGPATDFQALTSVEGISPNATGALVAPNNSITTPSTGPHGTASDASTAGSMFQMNTANAPTS
jgi:hypothetical protein